LFEKSTVAPLEVELSVESGGETLARERIERHFLPPASGAGREPVDREGLFGVLFLPAGKGPHPALICLSGSGGGISEPRASLLASRGYAALALAYFGAGSLPGQLREIPVEFIERGISWLGEHETVDSGRVGVCGISKGGELALLLGSLYLRIKAVAALSGSSFVWQAPGRGRVRSSWSRGGKPVPCLRMRVPLADILRLARGQAVAFRRSYQRGLRAAADSDLAAIPVERVRGPVFLAAGTDDRVWPAAAFAEAVVARRRMHGCDCRYFRAEGAGHLVSLPYLPAAEVCRNLVFASANAETNARAAIGAWDAMIDFFDRVFKG
jgi:dienelactone hydrolase